MHITHRRDRVCCAHLWVRVIPVHGPAHAAMNHCELRHLCRAEIRRKQSDRTVFALEVEVPQSLLNTVTCASRTASICQTCDSPDPLKCLARRLTQSESEVSNYVDAEHAEACIYHACQRCSGHHPKAPLLLNWIATEIQHAFQPSSPFLSLCWTSAAHTAD